MIIPTERSEGGTPGLRTVKSLDEISHLLYMGFSNGQVQSSSDIGKGEKGDPGVPGIGFNLTDDGNFDLDGKRLTDVADPVEVKLGLALKWLII